MSRHATGNPNIGEAIDNDGNVTTELDDIEIELWNLKESQKNVEAQFIGGKFESYPNSREKGAPLKKAIYNYGF